MNSYKFVNVAEVSKFKAKVPEVNAASLGLDNVSKDLAVNNMKKTWLYWHVYDCSINYDGIDVDDILDIHKYVIKKHNIK